VEAGFHELGLNRIEIRCATGNKRSRSVAERLGFKPEGILRQSEWLYDHYVDHAVYAMLHEEFMAARPQ
jgi:ribosomal-protein-serine acetyltransferase